MNTTGRASEISLDRRTLLRSLLLATGGIITNSLHAEALTPTPCQKNNQLPIDATPNDESTTRAHAYLNSRLSKAEKEMEKQLAGVKMICIDDSFSDELAAKYDVLPVRGQVYTFRALRVTMPEISKPDIALLFDELVNTRLRLGREWGYCHTQFEEYCPEEQEE